MQCLEEGPWKVSRWIVRQRCQLCLGKMECWGKVLALPLAGIFHGDSRTARLLGRRAGANFLFILLVLLGDFFRLTEEVISFFSKTLTYRDNVRQTLVLCVMASQRP